MQQLPTKQMISMLICGITIVFQVRSPQAGTEESDDIDDGQSDPGSTLARTKAVKKIKLRRKKVTIVKAISCYI